MASATKSRLRAVPTVEPALGWTYLSCDALARAKAQMDEESMGVRDDIGFLTIHQGYGLSQTCHCSTLGVKMPALIAHWNPNCSMQERFR